MNQWRIPANHKFMINDDLFFKFVVIRYILFLI